MAYQDNGFRPQRQMVDVSTMNITCSECGAEIKELPFEPTKREDGTFGSLYCFDCNKKRRSNSGGGNRKFGGRPSRY